MKFLFLSSILLLLNVTPMPVPDSLAANAGHHLSENAGGLASNPQNLLGTFKGVLADIKLRIIGQLPMSFEEAKILASQRGESIDWAIQHHDPAKDDFAIIKKWYEMRRSRAKDELKEKMMLNPKIRNLFKIEPTVENLDNAIEWENLDEIKYLIARGVTPVRDNLYDAVIFCNRDIVEAVIRGGVNPDNNNLYHAILFDRPDIVQLLVENGVTPDEDNLNIAILKDKLPIVKYLIENRKRKVIPTAKNLRNAILANRPDIVLYLRKAGVKPTSDHLNTAIQYGREYMIKYLEVEEDTPSLKSTSNFMKISTAALLAALIASIYAVMNQMEK